MNKHTVRVVVEFEELSDKDPATVAERAKARVQRALDHGTMRGAQALSAEVVKTEPK